MEDVCVTLADREKDPERGSESREVAQLRVSNFKELIFRTLVFTRVFVLNFSILPENSYK